MKALAVFVGAGLLGIGTQADATIYLAMQQAGVNGGAVTEIVNDGGSGSLVYSGTYGTFSNSIQAQGTPLVLPQPTLLTGAINSSSTVGGKLTIYITQTDLNAYNGNLVSSFTSNLFSGMATSVVETTLLDKANGKYTGTQLATKTYTGLGSDASTTGVSGVTGKFSETAKYEITFGAGSSAVNDTINLNPGAVPEPASWALMLVGFGFIGASLRQRRRAVVSFG